MSDGLRCLRSMVLTARDGRPSAGGASLPLGCTAAAVGGGMLKVQDGVEIDSGWCSCSSGFVFMAPSNRTGYMM